METEQKNLLEQYKIWILSQKIPNVTVADKGEQIIFNAKSAEAVLSFFDLDFLIVEMRVNDDKNADEDKFYLHFELSDLNSAKENFNSMIQSLVDENNRSKLKILFSCTGGLTTGYFAEKLNEAAKILARKFEFEAVPVTKIDEVGADYDVIMIAPQIGYKLKEISNKFPESLVLKIPLKVFAAYDANELVKFFNWYSKYCTD